MQRRSSRRMLLGQAGFTLALPFLPSAFWSRRSGAATCTPPRRFVAWFAPNGMVMPAWTPATAGGAGNAWTMPPILSPLAPIRDKLVILTGLDHQDIAVPPPGSPTSPTEPATGTGCFLTMLPVEGHETDTSRISLDQALLPALNQPACGAPKFPSLQISLDYQNGLCGVANCAFSRTISWTDGTPWPSISDPGLLFDKLFAVAPGAADLAQRQALRKSVLDYVLDQTRSLTTQLSAADRLKLDAHTTLVRNLETRLERIGKSTSPPPVSPSCSQPSRPTVSSTNSNNASSDYIQTAFPILVDLMAMALECDITRSITFMIGTGNSENDYAFLTGSPTPHHATALAETTAGPNQAKLTQIDTYEIQQAANLLSRLDAVVEFDGRSVLDRTTFYLSSNVADGQAQNHWDMPVLIAGGSASGLRIDGRHINYIPQMPFPRPLVGPRSAVQTGRVFLSILQAHGIQQDMFGLSSGGPLPELML